MECLKCSWWRRDEKKCADEIEWIDETGEPCCRYREGAHLKYSLKEEIGELRAQNEKLLEEIGGLVVEKAELQRQILAMRNCLNCGHGDGSNTCGNAAFKTYAEYRNCVEENFKHWKQKESVQ
jgi:hypothetical protein